LCNIHCRQAIDSPSNEQAQGVNAAEPARVSFAVL